MKIHESNHTSPDCLFCYEFIFGRKFRSIKAYYGWLKKNQYIFDETKEVFKDLKFV